MKFILKLSPTLLAILCVTFGVVSVTSAAFTPISNSPDEFNEPNLLGINPYPGNLNPSVLSTLYGENNLRRVDDSFDTGFRHTGTSATVKPVARFNNPVLEDRL